MKQKIIIEIICLLLILLFVYAAMSKLLEYASFKFQFTNSPFLSRFSMVAWIIPVFELITSMMLISNEGRLISLIASFFLMLVFTVYMGSMLAFEKHLPCSCGGILQQLSWRQHLLFNIFFLGLSGWGIILQRSIKNLAVKISIK